MSTATDCLVCGTRDCRGACFAIFAVREARWVTCGDCKGEGTDGDYACDTCLGAGGYYVRDGEAT